MKYRHGDKVWIKNLQVEGTVIEERTRTIVVRFPCDDGELKEHQFPPEDLERMPTTKEKSFEHKIP